MKIVIINSVMGIRVKPKKNTILNNMEVFQTIISGKDRMYQLLEETVDDVAHESEWDSIESGEDCCILSKTLTKDKKLVKVIALDRLDEFNKKEMPKKWNLMTMLEVFQTMKEIWKGCANKGMETHITDIAIDRIKGNERFFAYLDIHLSDKDMDFTILPPYIKDEKIYLRVINHEAKDGKEEIEWQ